MMWRSLLRICLLLAAFLSLATMLPAKKKPPGAPVNLNTADSEQLQLVPGIGPATADKILQMRKSYGAFKSVDDLLAIRGIGPKRLEKMRKYLTVGRSPSVKPNAGANPATPASSPKAGAPPPAGSAVTKAAPPITKPTPKPATSDDDPPCLHL
jgi:competence protein ComEA